jgi:hypothetical protein
MQNDWGAVGWVLINNSVNFLWNSEITAAKLLVPDWGIKSTLAYCCRTGLPAEFSSGFEGKRRAVIEPNTKKDRVI